MKGIYSTQNLEKQKFAFKFELACFDKNGVKTLYDDSKFVKTLIKDSESGKTKTEVRLLFNNEDLHQFSDALKIQGFIVMKKMINIGTVSIKWKDCVTTQKDQRIKSLKF